MKDQKLAIVGGTPIRDDVLPYAKHTIREEDKAAVADCLSSGWVAGKGPTVKKFEEALAEYTGFDFAIATNSATSALQVAYEISPLPMIPSVGALTFIATANMLFAANYPGIRLVDPDYATLVSNGADVATSFAGYPVNTPASVVDDAHYLYPGYGRNVDSTSVLSFHPAKHITTGEGGAILTNDYDLYRAAYKLVDQGRGIGMDFSYGYNFRMPEMNAALGLSQLHWADSNLRRQRELAEQYRVHLEDFVGLTLPAHHPEHAWHLYTIRFAWNQDRDTFRNALFAEGIGTQIHYPPLNHYDHIGDVSYDEAVCPVAENAYASGLSLPLFSGMTNRDFLDVVNAFEKVYEGLEYG